MPILPISKYFITISTSLDGPMVCNVPEREEIYFILDFRLALKLHVYLFDVQDIGNTIAMFLL